MKKLKEHIKRWKRWVELYGDHMSNLHMLLVLFKVRSDLSFDWTFTMDEVKSFEEE